MINSLLEYDYGTIEHDFKHYGKSGFLYDILMSGWKGYDHHTDKELEQECTERGIQI